MHVSRRTLCGGALAAMATVATPAPFALAQVATPEAQAGEHSAPGYGIARVRTHPTAELLQAVYADVMANFLPATSAVPGYIGYIFAFDDSDPTASINITLLDNAAAVDTANAVAMDYVKGMDPRLTPETPFAEQGSVRVYELAGVSRTDLPPLLHGCHITMRLRVNAPNADMEAVVNDLNDGLAPMLAGMDGFILYCWILTEGGRVAINIWETAEQLAAGNEAVTVWAAENTSSATVGEPLVHSGIVGYSDIFGQN